ncbi:MAG: hypothetical protein ACNA8W_12110 [Bradymonadaceae bacterium]
MRQESKKSSIWAECLLWTLSSTVLVILAAAGTYIAGSIFQWGIAVTVVGAMCAGLFALTWGSWGSLIWSRRRAVRAGIESVTIVPGLLILALGFVGLYVGVGKMYLWLSLIVPSAGTVAVALLLARQSNRLTVGTGISTRWRHILAWTLFPLITLGAAGLVGYLWLSYVTRPVSADWRSLFNMASFMVSVLAMALITTVIPAMVSRLCCEISTRLESRENR